MVAHRTPLAVVIQAQADGLAIYFFPSELQEAIFAGPRLLPNFNSQPWQLDNISIADQFQCGVAGELVAKVQRELPATVVQLRGKLGLVFKIARALPTQLIESKLPGRSAGTGRGTLVANKRNRPRACCAAALWSSVKASVVPPG